jgi:hypothetical protein
MAPTLLEHDPAQPSTCVLAQYKRATEVITAAHHLHDSGTYIYAVRIDGGKHHNIEIHCRTYESTMWLFDQIVGHRRHDQEWLWLSESL